MRPLLSIAWLTVKAALRYRVFAVMAVLLLLAVVGLPLVIKDDGTARGFAQIMMTYTLGTITVLLGFATLWIACGSLAREIEECQLQMVDVKPVARWQVWLGKWLGIVALNAALLALAGGTVYAMVLSRANRLPTEPVNQRAALFNEVLVARASAKEKVPDVEAELERAVSEVRKRPEGETLNVDQLRTQLHDQVLAAHQVVPPNHLRRWIIDLSDARAAVRDRPLALRVRFFAAQNPGGAATFATIWEVGPLNQARVRLKETRLPAQAFLELLVPPNLLDEQGRLVIDCANRSETALLFPLEDGLEVLYRESGFALNFARGLLIILFWLALLAALGLAAGSGLSFPVAAFVALTALVVVLASGTMASVVEQGGLITPGEEEAMKHSWVDLVAVPAFKAVLRLINVVRDFSPIDSLSSGRSITWTQLARAFAQIVLLAGGLFAAIGITIFHRRELARAPGRS
ncbi:MAG: hypothetical protein HY301_14560 [Verrucomicrobia bacterium]|nr:hypothetical protein [Verrucomicrobiota bacterium]